MENLSDKKIILGVCGGIAAYKSADLVRRLLEAGAQVQVVMTSHAESFITPMTFQALSGNPVRQSLFDESAEAAMGHIELARWADMILIAPATANFIAELVHGLARDLLSTLCLATTADIAIVPAMNQAMWSNVATQENVSRLDKRGIAIFGPASGEQACGDVGSGRMLEPLSIREHVVSHFSATSNQSDILTDKNILLTAGPTRESIDPVRYISNHSSGKMGFALAIAARDAGANVTVISGPTAISQPTNVTVIEVQSAEDMLEEVMSRASDSDIFIAVAAVADYRVKETQNEKIKKSKTEMTLTLIKNPDILATVSSLKNDRPFCVGFAAETNDLQSYARGKLERKNLDMIAANLVTNEKDSVFNSDSNTLEVFLRDSSHISLPQASKQHIASQLITLIAEQHNKKDTH